MVYEELFTVGAAIVHLLRRSNRKSTQRFTEFITRKVRSWIPQSIKSRVAGKSASGDISGFFQSLLSWMKVLNLIALCGEWFERNEFLFLIYDLSRGHWCQHCKFRVELDVIYRSIVNGLDLIQFFQYLVFNGSRFCLYKTIDWWVWGGELHASTFRFKMRGCCPVLLIGSWTMWGKAQKQVFLDRN